MAGHDIVVVGASAGGVEALTELVRQLPADLPAAVFVVLHVPADGTSVLPQILTRRGPLPAEHPRDGAPIRPGRIYVAPPNRHLLLKDGHLRLALGPRENGHRPAIDPLFRTAARHYGRRVVGVVLSGTLDDGTAGLIAVKLRGGLAIAQHPDEALYSGMPRSAIDNVAVDHVLPIAGIASLLVELAHTPVADASGEPTPAEMNMEADMAELAPDALHNDERPGTPSGFGCPDCGGVLWELRDGEVTRFRCRVGHAWSPDSLLAEQAEQLEEALWIALRALQESGALARRLAERYQRQGQAAMRARFEQQAQDANSRAEVIRRVLLSREDTVAAGLAGADGNPEMAQRLAEGDPASDR